MYINQLLVPARVIVQSVNPEGSRAMLQILERRGVEVSWDPFSVRPDDDVDLDDLDGLESDGSDL
ncbi:MAG: hypothetical protein EBZ77_12585 [Chitinophagia bacterium]|nr:hypothetical protein [Chitinophagia bacterium]